MGAISMGMRQRFEDGGDAEAPPSPGYSPALTALLGRIAGNAGSQAPARRPPVAAVNSAMPQPSGPPDQPQAGGAMAAGVGDQNADPDAPDKLARIRQAMSILQAGGGVPSERPGAVNLPLLAAAGAMLGPTRTGGFSESVGSGLTAGAGALATQRQQDEQARLRQAQQADTALWRQGMLGVNQQRADTGDTNAQTKQWVAQRMMQLKAQGMSDTAAFRQASIDARVYGIDTRADTAAAGQAARSSDVEYRTDARTASDQAKLDQQRIRWLKSDAAKAIDQNLRQRGIDSRLINSALIAASRDIQVMNGKKPVQQAVDEWLRAQGAGMQRIQGGAAPPQAGAPDAPSPVARAQSAAPAGATPQAGRAPTANEIAGAQAAIKANPANREIVLQRLRAAGVNPPPGL